MKKIFNKLILLLLTFALVFLISSQKVKAKAVGLTITCSASTSSCTTSGGPLFNETNMAPGDFVPIKTFVVDNTDNPDDCSLYLNAENTTESEAFANFPTRLITFIYDNGGDLFGDHAGINPKTFSDLFSQGNISLGTVPAGGSKTYNWSVNFDKDSGNTFQNNNLTFNFSLNFSCGTAPTPTPAAGGGGTLGAAGAPVCTDTAPSGAPKLLSAVATGNNSVKLTWTPAPDPVTYYLITYGTTPGAQTYGNPNVGGHGTTTYTVNGLSGGLTYYFRVRAGNSCTPGPFSNELSTAVTGIVLAGPAAGFAPGVLGTETVSGATPSPAPQVLGTECVKSAYPWWIFLILELVAIILIIRRGLINKWGMGKLILLLIAVAILSQIIHEVVGCNCITSGWCSKYLWGNLIILLLPSAYSLYLFSQKNR